MMKKNNFITALRLICRRTSHIASLVFAMMFLVKSQGDKSKKQQKSKIFEPFFKRAQIQSGELIMIVIVVMMFLVMGLVGYANFQERNINQVSQEFESLAAVELAQQALSLQEMKCGFAVETSDQCVDLYRVRELSSLLADTELSSSLFTYYRSVFGESRIIIEKIYPEYELFEIYDIGEGDENPIRIPIYIYDPLTKENTFGVITVVKYT